MKNEAAPPPVTKRRKGLALVTVLSMMALITIIMLAFLSTADTEFKSTKISSDGETARQLAENATSLVIGQIQAGSLQGSGATRTFHATQPGAIRKYNASGALAAAYKLYSDSQMIITTPGIPGELALATDEPPGNWNTMPERYVDLNEPVVRAKAGSNTPSLFFPIVDPRAAAAGSEKVEGFDIFDKTKLGTGSPLNGVVNNGAEDNMRVPMPVEWIYVLKNGAMGSLNAGGKFIPAGGAESTPTEDNPIVGRIAFWTDDESCKVNINTASEPAYWAPPHFYHERDKGWNDYPPVKFEYQRYPGHPATVALSSILYPNRDLDPYGLTGAGLDQVLIFREKLYDLAPKVNRGGSRSGTLPFDPDDFDSNKAPLITVDDVRTSLQERLYVSLDELRFSENMIGGSRDPNKLENPAGAGDLLSPEKLERSRFFLTANSRAPEFSIMGVPRVAMWPIPELYEHPTLGQNQTTYDKLIAFCASIRNSGGSHLYAFQRKDAHDQLTDIQLTRNSNLMEYLYKMMAKTWPGVSSGGGVSFEEKYGVDDAHQILVQIFDYIRCTNLYDSELSLEGREILAKADPEGWGRNNLTEYADTVLVKGGTLHDNNNSTKITQLYEERDRLRDQRKYITYTEPHYETRRTDDGRGHGGEIPDVDAIENGYPGHGQVSPSRWNFGAKDYQGLGRTVTISEVGLHFICTADGKNSEPNEPGSFDNWAYVAGQWQKTGVRSGGRSAPKAGYPDDYEASGNYTQQTFRFPAAAPQEPAYWYSNYPPFPSVGRYGTGGNGPDSSNARNHPGFHPPNWNATLERDTPLTETQKRIQCMLQIELFCPSVGWTGFDPEYTLVLDGNDVSGIEINGQAVFSTTTDMPIKSGRQTYSAERFASTTHRVGGSASFRNMVANRRAKPIGPLTDPGYDASASSQKHGKLFNMDFVSNFKTVDRERFTFQVRRPLKIKIFDTHDWEKKRNDPVQSLTIPFPSEEQNVRSPSLITVSSPYRIVVNQTNGDRTEYLAAQAPRFWCFNYGGCIGRYQGSASGYVSNPNSVTLNNGTNGLGGRLRGDAYTAANGVPGGSHTTTAFNLPLSMYKTGESGTRAITVSHMAQLIWGVTDRSGRADTAKLYRTNNVKINTNFIDNPIEDFGYDIVRSMVPRYGDYRLVAARREVPPDLWVRHPLWSGGDDDVVLAHNMSAHSSTAEPGFDRSGDPDNQTTGKFRLVADALYTAGQNPDVPHSEETMAATNRYRDWDNAVGSTRDGAYINKPDEGNFAKFHFWIGNGVRVLRSGYLFDSQESSSGAPTFFTPNRMISSPVMFGSLPTGVWGSKAPSSAPDMNANGVPWRTLLFRPHTVPQPNSAGNMIPDSDEHPGKASPPDHYLLDLFFMPVVEPYAISEPLSQAGKINVNYQIVPFTHIKRATGLHALLKGELMAAIWRGNPKVSDPVQRNGNAPYYKTDVVKTPAWPLAYWSDKKSHPGTSGENAKARNFYRKINAAETIKGLDERFSHVGAAAGTQGLLRSASQFCEVHLVPQNAPIPDGTSTPDYTGKNVNGATMTSAATRQTQMNQFWEAHSLTGDNMRERPYANIYSRITTRSNTFRVFIRAQAISKARSSGVDTIDASKDKAVGEYRGSRLIERYIDPTNTNSGIPDYALAADPYVQTPRLEEFYRFRVLEAKRFDP